MSQEETQGQEPFSTHQPAADAGTNEVRTPTPRIHDAKLESAHAEIPPLSVIGATAEPAAKPGTIATPKQFGRRGAPRGAAPTSNGQAARPAIGVVEDPSQLTENISGDLSRQSAAKTEQPRERRETREPRPEGASYGDRPRREPREPRQEGNPPDGARQEGIPQGDRPRREPRESRPEGAGYGDRPRREPRQEGFPQGERTQGDRPRREPRESRPEGTGYGDRPRREERPRIQIEPVVIPVQAPIGFWASVKRKLATLFGIPNKAVFVPAERPSNSRGEHHGERPDRGHRGGRGHGDSRGGSRDGSRGGRGDFRGDRGPRNGPREG